MPKHFKPIDIRGFYKMITSTELVEQLQAKNGACSVYRVAKIYGWGNGRVLNWVSGRAAPSPKESLKIADDLGLPRAYVVACMEAQRQSEPELAEVFEQLASLSTT